MQSVNNCLALIADQYIVYLLLVTEDFEIVKIRYKYVQSIYWLCQSK